MSCITKLVCKVTLILVVVLSLQACTSMTSLMFWPLKSYPADPSYFGLEFEVVEHQAADETQLVSWWLPAQGTAKGSILVLHGNAQNISYHQMSVHWLVKAGYNVFLLGYREYGQSQGEAIIPDIFMDVHAGLDWILDHQQKAPVVILGQSMGASLSVYGLASYPRKHLVDGVILDAAFSSYPDIAAQAMSRNWVSWIFQFPAYAITRDYDPIEWVHQLNVPLLMFHSPDDKTVPYDQGQKLFIAAPEPKQWVSTHGKHIATFSYPEWRDVTLKFLGNLPLKPVNTP